MSQFLDTQTRSRIEELCRVEARLVMVKMGFSLDELDKLDLVRVKYHARRTSTAGTGSATLVTINLHLNKTEAELTETLMHELAHSICAIKYKDAVGHGRRWKDVMLCMGREPKRCHAIDLSEVYPDKWRKCNCSVCDTYHLISKRKVKQAKRGSVIMCNCGKPIVVLTKQELETANRLKQG